MTARVANEQDFDKLMPLMQANAQKMQYEWEKYSFGARHILSNSDYGFFILAEMGDQVVGFVSFTFEWSDWRNGACFYLQGLQVAGDNSDAIISTLKSGLEAHKATLDFSCTGVRFYNPKVVHSEAVEAIQAFELEPTHYYVYHIDTVN